jgi:hypothetical protein
MFIKKMFCICLFTITSLLTLLHCSCGNNTPTAANTPTPTITSTPTITLTPTATPIGPTMNAIPNQTASKSGSPLHVTLSSSDPLSNPVTYSVNTAIGLSVSGNTLTANVSSYTVGAVITVTVTGTDTVTTGTGSTTFNITVTA